MLSWLADFTNALSDINYAQYVILSNKDIRIDNKPIFYKKYVDCGIVYLNDGLFILVNIRSLEYRDTGLDCNFLIWSALRLSVPKDKLSFKVTMGHYVVELGKTFYPHSASLDSGKQSHGCPINN